jgi:hypothetical protein
LQKPLFEKEGLGEIPWGDSYFKSPSLPLFQRGMKKEGDEEGRSFSSFFFTVFLQSSPTSEREQSCGRGSG